MEVDSSMPAEPDHDPAAANHHDPANGTSSPLPASGTASPPVEAQAVAAGPRPAPTFSVVNAIIEKKEDGPGCRCGHTLTAVAAVGEEGTPGYIGPRLILFGGATALEGNSAAPASPAGSAGIRLAGATADVHCYDVLSNKWTRLTPLGEPPSPRAAHVATAVGTMVVIQGGIGPAGLSAEDRGSSCSGPNTTAATEAAFADVWGPRYCCQTIFIYLYDIVLMCLRLTPLGEPPSPRAAHVATAVGTMVVIQGGIGPAGLFRRGSSCSGPNTTAATVA
ncbi:hypothetical protein C4D60_Mb04t29990 [Musa balbisiana]|uniref:Serine/threonine-protein phosphatase BSL3 n=1 Tax=Musa balbisiana TaxID=52838 RepID=A0A4S8KFT7_MUSBA|nr:hypothetical protein C4D60_Mb04t29990 [Musa balbisiana]